MRVKVSKGELASADLLENGGGIVFCLHVCLLEMGDFRSHLRTPALKTENFSKKIGRFSKTRKWIY